MMHVGSAQLLGFRRVSPGQAVATAGGRSSCTGRRRPCAQLEALRQTQMPKEDILNLQNSACEQLFAAPFVFEIADLVECSRPLTAPLGWAHVVRTGDWPETCLREMKLDMLNWQALCKVVRNRIKDSMDVYIADHLIPAPDIHEKQTTETVSSVLLVQHPVYIDASDEPH
eukprot:6194655-Pleurochrysis_carterae.AAC.4